MHGKEVAITEALKAIFCARLGEKEGETKWEGGTVCAKSFGFSHALGKCGKPSTVETWVLRLTVRKVD